MLESRNHYFRISVLKKQKLSNEKNANIKEITVVLQNTLKI